MLIKHARSTTQVELITGTLKTAGVAQPVQDFINTLKPDYDHTYALVTAMSYSEFFGPNSNTDWYGYNHHLDFNGLLHSWSDFGRDPKLDAIKARDWPHGYPCFYAATAYAHHKNTDPKALGFGDVIFVHANPHMRRIELVIRVFNDEARRKGHASIVERIERGDRVDVSMGTKVPFDACSRCTDWDRVREAMGRFDPTKHKHVMMPVLEEHKRHKIQGIAENRSQYCVCMRTHAGQIMDDGVLVYVYNDAPRFFDISFVIVGADRTARVMWHLPALKKETRQEKVAFPAALKGLEGLSTKTASMNKVDPDGSVSLARPDLSSAPTGNPHGVLAGLARMGIVCSPSEFSQITVGMPIHFPPSSATQVDRSFAVDGSHVLGDLLEKLIRLPRKAPAEPKTQIKKASLLADSYAGYRLSLLQNAGSLLGEDSAIKISSSKVGFLLPQNTVVEWITSHMAPDPSMGPGADLLHLASMIGTTKDLEKVGHALDGVLRVENTSSLWTALTVVANASTFL